MNYGDKDLGDRLRAYAKKSGKTATNMADEMKFPIKSYPKGKKRQATAPYGVSAICSWLNEERNPTGNCAEVVTDYLRRMKA